MRLIIKPMGRAVPQEPEEPQSAFQANIKKRGHVFLDGPVQMRKGEMRSRLGLQGKLSKVLAHLLAGQEALPREWNRNVFVRPRPYGPSEEQIEELLQEAAAEIALHVMPPEDLPQA